MKNSTEIDVAFPPPRWKTLLRQNSEKIGSLAEHVVLPKNQRSGQQDNVPEVILLRDIEAVDAQDFSLSTVVIERPQQQITKKFPIFLVAISIVQVVLIYTVNNHELILAFCYDPHRRHEVWRLLTIMLAHKTITRQNKNSNGHLWGNVIMQLIIGIPLEIVHHYKRIAIIYLSSVVGGSLFISVLSRRTYTVGASAATYGLLFSHFSTLILNWNEMDRKFCRLFWLLAYVCYSIYSSISSERKGSEAISHAGHFGGAITGFLVSILVLKNFKSHPWEKKLQKICSTILVVLGVTILIINLVWGLYLPTEWNFDYNKTYDMYITKFILQRCKNIPECKSILHQYKMNGTI